MLSVVVEWLFQIISKLDKLSNNLCKTSSSAAESLMTFTLLELALPSLYKQRESSTVLETCYKISQKSKFPGVFSMSNINISNPSKQQASLLLCVSDSIFRVLVFIPTYGTVITGHGTGWCFLKILKIFLSNIKNISIK